MVRSTIVTTQPLASRYNVTRDQYNCRKETRGRVSTFHFPHFGRKWRGLQQQRKQKQKQRRVFDRLCQMPIAFLRVCLRVTQAKSSFGTPPSCLFSVASQVVTMPVRPDECDPTRVRCLTKKNTGVFTEGSEKPGKCILYWMSRDQRAADNWALIYAQDLARMHNAHIRVAFNVVPKFLEATERQ